MGKIFYQYFRSLVFGLLLVAFLFGAFFEAVNQGENSAKAQGATVYNPAYLYYDVSRATGVIPESTKTKIIVRWANPTNISNYTESAQDADLKYRVIITVTDPQGKRTEHKKTQDYHDSQNHEYSYEKNQFADWGDKVHIRVHLADLKLSTSTNRIDDITARIGFLEEQLTLPTTQGSGFLSEASGSCPVENVKSTIISTPDYDVPFIRIDWTLSEASGCPKRKTISSGYSSYNTGQVIEVTTPDGDKSHSTNLRYQGPAKLQKYILTTYEGNWTSLDSTNITGDPLGVVEVTVNSLEGSTDSISGRIDANPSEGGQDPSNRSGAGVTAPTGTYSSQDRCRAPFGGLLNIPGSIQYYICLLGEWIFNRVFEVYKWSIERLIDVAAISTPQGGQTYLIGELKGDNVKRVWNYSLALVDMVVIILLLIVAFANILRVNLDTYTVKKVLPGLIMGIVAAHFSYFLIFLLIDFNNQLVGYIFSLFGNGVDGIARGITDLIFANDALNVLVALPIINFLAVFLILVPLIFIVILMALLFARIYILFLLTMVAPLALVAMGIPQLSQYFKQWWKAVVNWTFMPLVIFIILGAGASFSTMTPPLDTQNALHGLTPQGIAKYFIGLLILYMAYKIPMKNMGGSVGAAISGGAKTVGNFARDVGGGAWSSGLGKLANASEAKEGDSGGKMAAKWFGRQAVAYANLSSPSMWKRAFKERAEVSKKNQDDREKDAISQTAGLKQATGDEAVRKLEEARKQEIAENQSEETLRERMEKLKEEGKVQPILNEAADSLDKKELDEAGLGSIAAKEGMERNKAIDEEMMAINERETTRRERAAELAKRRRVLEEKAAKGKLDPDEDDELKGIPTTLSALEKEQETDNTKMRVLSKRDGWISSNWNGSKSKWIETARRLGINASDAAEIRAVSMNLAKKERQQSYFGRQSIGALMGNPTTYVTPRRRGDDNYGGDGGDGGFSGSSPTISPEFTLKDVNISQDSLQAITKAISHHSSTIDDVSLHQMATTISNQTGGQMKLDDIKKRIQGTQAEIRAAQDNKLMVEAQTRLTQKGIGKGDIESLLPEIQNGLSEKIQKDPSFSITDHTAKLNKQLGKIQQAKTSGADAQKIIDKTVVELSQVTEISGTTQSKFDLKQQTPQKALEELERYTEKQAKALEAINAQATSQGGGKPTAETINMITAEQITPQIIKQEKVSIKTNEFVDSVKQLPKNTNQVSDDVLSHAAHLAREAGVKADPQTLRNAIMPMLNDIQRGRKGQNEIIAKLREIDQTQNVPGNYGDDASGNTPPQA